ncbi:MAG: hypothetical protein ACR2RL_15085, partial [Gammaproteobacteria bacterium]
DWLNEPLKITERPTVFKAPVLDGANKNAVIGMLYFGAQTDRLLTVEKAQSSLPSDTAYVIDVRDSGGSKTVGYLLINTRGRSEVEVAAYRSGSLPVNGSRAVGILLARTTGFWNANNLDNRQNVLDGFTKPNLKMPDAGCTEYKRNSKLTFGLKTLLCKIDVLAYNILKY